MSTETIEKECRGVQWLRSQKPGIEISELGTKVADIIDRLYVGIYHKDDAVLHKRVQWNNPSWIEIVVYDRLSTFDSDRLTHLVLLAHDYCVRVEISAAAPQYLRLGFSPRMRKGEVHQRHPNIESAIATYRSR
jgi:hypothetical protein